jgi:SAM-dependent methyltransferase
VADPLYLLQESRRVLKPGGRAVFVTPNVERLGFEFYDDYSHIRPFTRRGLDRAASDAGFAKHFVTYYHKGIPLTKLLHRRGTLSLEGALRVQSFFAPFGGLMKDTLVLVAEK